MREILFRGKCLHDNEWFEGESILQNNDFTLIAKAVTLGINEKGIANLIRDSIFNAVVPETVSEFTSLTDKNGKKIFEGDIVKHFVQSDILINVGVVNWDNKNARWALQLKTMNPCFTMFNPDAFEVIGNIHDNPELLKEGATQ